MPVELNAPTLRSRLVRHSAKYVLKSALKILWIFDLSRPFRFSATFAFFLALPGFFACIRFLVIWSMGDDGGKILTLIIGGAFIVFGMVFLIWRVLAEMVAASSALLAEIRFRQIHKSFETNDRLSLLDRN